MPDLGIPRQTFGVVLRTLATALIGGVITLLFMTMQTQNSISQRISRLEAIVDPLNSMRNDVVDLKSDVSALKSTAQRNVEALDRIEKKIDAHMLQR